MIIELHMLQNFAPSCLNRDDTNSPKECQFGGYRRARISSQCIKRSIRESFKENLLIPQDALARRTKKLVDILVTRLEEKGKQRDKAIIAVINALKSIGFSVTDNETQYLVFVGNKEADKIADVILEHWDKLLSMGESQKQKSKKKESTESLPAEISKELKGAMDGGKAVDLALFGRMIADLKEKCIDAACQVAHAISTNKVGVEFDFFTALDDLQTKESESGAAMMGTVEFNSACYYRYANINLDTLKDNLGGDSDLAQKSVEAFIRASVKAIPTGKQASMAAQNPPSFIFAVVRNADAWSLANAFIKPVYTGNDGDLVKQSIDSLVEYWNKLTRVYGEKGIKAKPAVTLEEIKLEGMSKVNNLDLLIQEVMNAVSSSQN